MVAVLQQTGTTDIYISDQPGVGWNSNYEGDVEANGTLWDYVNHRLVNLKVESLEIIQDHSSFGMPKPTKCPKSCTCTCRSTTWKWKISTPTTLESTVFGGAVG